MVFVVEQILTTGTRVTTPPYFDLRKSSKEARHMLKVPTVSISITLTALKTGTEIHIAEMSLLIIQWLDKK